MLLDNDYIVGIPSGEIINITSSVINYLKYRGLISYSKSINKHVFKDGDFNQINELLAQRNQNSNYENFLSHRIYEFMSKQTECQTYSISKDGSVSVKGNIIVENDDNLSSIPFKFKNIQGDFIIKGCKIQHLTNSPDTVSGDFIVSSNDLFDLIDGPHYVGGNYDCSDNILTTLKGSPESILHDFNCSENLIQTLKGAPKRVWGIFDCTKNKYLTTLDNAPICDNLKSDIEK